MEINVWSLIWKRKHNFFILISNIFFFYSLLIMLIDDVSPIEIHLLKLFSYGVVPRTCALGHQRVGNALVTNVNILFKK